MWKLKNKTEKETDRFFNTENKLVVTRREVGGVWKIGKGD